MKNVSGADEALESFLEEFKKANGRDAQPSEVEEFKQALAKYEAVPIQEKIADLKWRIAAKQG